MSIENKIILTAIVMSTSIAIAAPSETYRKNCKDPALGFSSEQQNACREVCSAGQSLKELEVQGTPLLFEDLPEIVGDNCAENLDIFVRANALVF